MRFYFLSIILLSVLSLNAQDKLTPLSSSAAFEKQLVQAASAVTSIESDFTQVKYVDMLQKSVISKGRFYYKTTDRICMEYVEPVKYGVTINGKKIKIVSDGKKNVYDLNSNRQLQQIQTLLAACMRGNFASLSGNYRLAYNENSKLYEVELTPINPASVGLSKVEVYLSKSDYSVERIKLLEPTADYTEYAFTAKKKNVSISDKKFEVK